jgi:cation transport ATPase
VHGRGALLRYRLRAADVALVGDDLTDLPVAIRPARRTLRTIRQNITASLLVTANAPLLLRGDTSGGANQHRSGPSVGQVCADFAAAATPISAVGAG